MVTRSLSGAVVRQAAVPGTPGEHPSLMARGYCHAAPLLRLPAPRVLCRRHRAPTADATAPAKSRCEDSRVGLPQGVLLLCEGGAISCGR